MIDWKTLESKKSEILKLFRTERGDRLRSFEDIIFS